MKPRHQRMILIGGVLALARAAVATPPPACLGLEAVTPGTSWTYTGWRQWTAEGRSGPDSAAVEWTTTSSTSLALAPNSIAPLM